MVVERLVADGYAVAAHCAGNQSKADAPVTAITENVGLTLFFPSPLSQHWTLLP